MFRIDLVPYGNDNSSSVNFSGSKTFYGSLSTCKKDSTENNILATIGRKGCDINIENDKCISRRHLSIELIQVDVSDESSENEERLEVLKREQKMSKSECNVIVCVRDMGSRFGSFLDRSSLFLSSGTKKDKGGGSETESDTDGDDNMEDGTTDKLQSQQGGSQIQIQMQCKQAYMLCSSVNQIKLGSSGTTIIIKHIPLSFCFTSLDKKLQMPTNEQLLQIGATSQKSWRNNQTTHLVAQALKTTPKILTAKVSHVPIVTLEYINALLSRDSIHSEYPKTDNYIPEVTNKTPVFHREESGLNSYDETIPLKKPLDKYGILCISKNEDIEALIEAAGGIVFAAYQIPTKKISFQSVDEWVEKNPLAETLVILEPTVTKATGKPKKDHQKKLDFLLGYNKKKLQVTSASSIASSITSVQPLLKDIDGIDIVLPSNNNPEDDDNNNNHGEKEKDKVVSSIEEKSPTKESSEMNNIAQEASNETEKNEPNDNEIETVATSTSDSATQHTKKRKHSKDIVETESIKQQQQLQPSQQTKTQSAKRTKRSGWIDTKSSSKSGRKEKQKARKDNESSTKTNEINHEKMNDDADVDNMEETTDERSRNEKTQSSQRQQKERRERKSILKKTSDKNGWFSVAPKDALTRKKFRKQRMESLQDGEQYTVDYDDILNDANERDFEKADAAELSKIPKHQVLLLEPAGTKALSNLVVNRREPEKYVHRYHINSELNSFYFSLCMKNPKNTENTIDYKKFKKNTVVSNSAYEKIEFEAVLPKESKVRQQLEITQEIFEKEQREADALFLDGDIGITRKGKKSKTKTASSTAARRKTTQSTTQISAMEDSDDSDGVTAITNFTSNTTRRKAGSSASRSKSGNNNSLISEFFSPSPSTTRTSRQRRRR